MGSLGRKVSVCIALVARRRLTCESGEGSARGRRERLGVERRCAVLCCHCLLCCVTDFLGGEPRKPSDAASLVTRTWFPFPVSQFLWPALQDWSCIQALGSAPVWVSPTSLDASSGIQIGAGGVQRAGYSLVGRFVSTSSVIRRDFARRVYAINVFD